MDVELNTAVNDAKKAITKARQLLDDAKRAGKRYSKREAMALESTLSEIHDITTGCEAEVLHMKFGSRVIISKKRVTIVD